MYISIHIPKTAGTTLGYILDYGMRRRIMYDYLEDYLDGPHTEFLTAHKEFITKYFDIIHGHFWYEKYSDTFPDAKYISTVRHPVDRVISQYLHNMNLHPDTDVWPAREIMNGELSLVEFSKLPNICDAQAKFLTGRSIDDYDFIFLTEKLEKSVAVFGKMTGFCRSDPYMGLGLPELNNHRSRKKKIVVTEEEKREIFKNTQEDNEIYRKSVEKLKRLEKKYQ